MIDLRRDRIRRVRRAGRGDALTARRELEREVGHADLAPAGFPPGAIVCVRHLRTAGDQGRMAAQLARQVADLLPELPRPLREAVPANAPGVIFLDEAELLACLARDWLRGDEYAWWWRSLFLARPDQALVRRELAAAPRYVPAVVQLLGEQRLAVPLLRELPGSCCQELAAAVARAFRVPWEEAEPTPVNAGGQQARAPRRLENLLRDVALAWAGPGEVEDLDGPRRALLGLALVLRRAPVLAREPWALASIRNGEWAAGEASTPAGRPRLETGPEPELPRPPAGGAQAAVVASPTAPAQPGADSVLHLDAALPEPTPGHSPQPALAQALSPAAATQPVGTVADTTGAADDLIRASAVESAGRGGTVFVASRFAGVLYLVNLALYLDLYGDFTEPLRPVEGLAPGDFLALVGLRVCGEELLDDALWRICAELAGRAEAEPPPDDDATRARVDELVSILELHAGRALEREAALEFLCRRAGRIALTPVRLTVEFPLEEHPLAIRLAGLDRDPGWVPALGRIMEFRYE